MAVSIQTSFVDSYSRILNLLSQQKGSVLAKAVTNVPDVKGSRFSVDALGAGAASAQTTRGAPTPVSTATFSRRWAAMTTYGYGDLIDKQDRVRELVDPQSALVKNAVQALGRAKDDEIIAAATGVASTGQSGTTTSAFPAANIIPVNASGLTVAKLLLAKEMLNAADVDPDEPMYIALKSHQLTNLLSTTEVTSIWYNSVKPLVEGRVDKFMGFSFVRTERLLLDAATSTDVQVLAFTQSGIAIGEAETINVSVAPDPSVRFSARIYAENTIGAVRAEDAKVISILCDPTL